MEYLVLIERAGPNFCARSPDVPGCVATGDTVEEAQSNYRRMLAIYFRGLRERGEELPTPRTVGVTVDVEGSA